MAAGSDHVALDEFLEGTEREDALLRIKKGVDQGLAVANFAGKVSGLSLLSSLNWPVLIALFAGAAVLSFFLVVNLAAFVGVAVVGAAPIGYLAFRAVTSAPQAWNSVSTELMRPNQGRLLVETIGGAGRGAILCGRSGAQTHFPNDDGLGRGSKGRICRGDRGSRPWHSHRSGYRVRPGDVTVSAPCLAARSANVRPRGSSDA